MSRPIVNGKYKIIKVLSSDWQYEASVCHNVTLKNDYAMNVVNIYKGKEAIKSFLPLYFGMTTDTCREFEEIICSEGTVSAVFEYHSGEEVADFFGKHPTEAYDEKLEYAELLLRSALELDMVDDRIAACVLKQGVVLDPRSRKFHFNYIISPDVEPESGFRAKRLGEMMTAIFRPNRYLPVEIEDFCLELCNGKYGSCVEIYSTWKQVREAAEATRKQYLKESFLKYLIRRSKRKREQMKLKKKRAREQRD